MRRLMTAAVAAALLTGSATPAGAVTLHQHLLDTPGAQDIAVAQGLCTAATRGGQHDTAFHNFHGNVHLDAFQQSDPIGVTTTAC